MTAATLARIDGRAKDLIAVPRAALQESFIDVQAAAFDARREVAKAYVAEKRGTDPLPRELEEFKDVLKRTVHA